MATTIDGFIAKSDGNSDWVSPVDTDNFMAQIMEKGCVIVGNNTYNQFLGDLYPVDGVLNVVVTSKPDREKDGVIFVSGSPNEIVELIEKKGHTKALLIGGGTTNSKFLEAGLVDEIILTIHPITLGKGIPLFNGNEVGKSFELTDVEKLGEGLVKLYYKAK